ncbi:hypothetical protein FUT87_17065 [Mitsuaria sp. TWR114]|uniref:hypothetical protein n=1 Tax=unclassified Roseateles TaxID=2626991 RepID=UPI0011BD4B59|nr:MULTISPECIES: hypothetical protein [unclassified Roseateles]TXD80597.1 hypothetical protein FUT87_19030 [Mitsuaria sp. TWR114]TXD82608.1 hypothetical protein FUT87_17065 [Mitsuaria sp. TWR114]
MQVEHRIHRSEAPFGDTSSRQRRCLQHRRAAGTRFLAVNASAANADPHRGVLIGGAAGLEEARSRRALRLPDSVQTPLSSMKKGFPCLP